MSEKSQPARWSAATQYADMWVDPEQDPRNTDGLSPDGELPTLLDYLSSYRQTLLMKCEGLSSEQLATQSVPPSALSLLGLLRHLAQVERHWRLWVDPDADLLPLYGNNDGAFTGLRGSSAEVEQAKANLAREQDALDARLAQFADLGERVGSMKIAVRELQVHRIEEYARHCGHADLLRERIDGRVGQ